MASIITLTTDFGFGSPYVAQMKGVILSICREVELIDISHAIGAQNVREGAVVLADATPRFPAGTIHVAVIDPGVGTARRIIYAEIGGQRYVAPDNGLLSLLARKSKAGKPRFIALEDPQFWLPQRSFTFHGRDIMAPVAARLAGGLEPAGLGPPLDECLMLDWPQPVKTADRVVGEVLYVDSFGNLITNIDRDDLEALGSPASRVIECCGRQIRGLVTTYGAAPARELVALTDSQGRLEIALVQGSAAAHLQADVGETVTISSYH